MIRILTGDWIEQVALLPAESVQCCVTSPPYWGLRDYGNPAQLGLEKTPEEYVAKMVAGFREVRRVLKSDGTLWLNLGDSYAAGKMGRSDHGCDDPTVKLQGNSNGAVHVGYALQRPVPTGLKPKDLVGIPWMVAFALRADGWWLRQDIIWAKPNPMPESVTDRPTKAHEYLFLLRKSAQYFYDAAAIREPASDAMLQQVAQGYDGESTKLFEVAGAQNGSDTKSRIINGARAKIDKQRGHSRRHAGFNDRWDHLSKEEQQAIGSNKRSVWAVATAPYPEAHFATYPPDLIKPCILAGSKPGDTILDPFGGSGTTGMVAIELGRKAVLIELNPDYVKLIEQRCDVTAGLAL